MVDRQAELRSSDEVAKLPSIWGIDFAGAQFPVGVTCLA